MSDPIETYTYRNGERIDLRKLDNEFTVWASDSVVRQHSFAGVLPLTAFISQVHVPPSDLEQEMSQARAIAPTHHVYEIAGTDQRFVPTQDIFITFHEGVGTEQREEFLQRYKLLFIEQLSGQTLVARVTTDTGMNPAKLVSVLTEDESEKAVLAFVDNVLFYRVQKQGFQPPVDPDYIDSQWHLHTHTQHPDFDARSSTNCEKAWEYLGNFGSEDVVIGITDDGCRLNHSDFSGANKFAGWGYFGFYADNANRYSLFTPHDTHADPNQMYVEYKNHGTACAGVAAANTNGTLVVGAAPNCRLLPIRFDSYGADGTEMNFDDLNIYHLLQYLADKIDILSNSWGYASNNLFARVVQLKIRELAISGGRRGKGIIFVWSAGNQNRPLHFNSNTAVPFTSGWQWRREFDTKGIWLDPTDEWIGVIAAFKFRNDLVEIPGVMHVAALTSQAKRSHYSNYGFGLSICAPSSNWHTYGRDKVSGLPIVTTSGMTTTELNPEFGGTSSAAPLVAGIAALVISANPNLSALEVISILKQTASKDLDFTGYPRTMPQSYDLDPGWDISPIAPFDKGDFQELDLPDGTWSPWFGHGRVDAAAAVEIALARLAQ